MELDSQSSWGRRQDLQAPWDLERLELEVEGSESMKQLGWEAIGQKGPDQSGCQFLSELPALPAPESCEVFDARLQPQVACRGYLKRLPPVLDSLRFSRA